MLPQQQWATKLSPIVQLPNELLESIFDIYVTWVYSQDYKDPKCFIAACTHVCRWWRNVALGSPRLWRYIDICRPRVNQMFFMRSRFAVPLSLVSSFGGRLPLIWVAPTARSALIDRVREIDVDLQSIDMRRWLSTLGSQVPQLTSLRLVSRKLQHAGMGAEDIEAPKMDLPSLRRLSLNSVAIGWASLSNLTHLAISGLCEAHAPSLDQIHTMLKNSPRLESLHLAFLMRRGLGPVSGSAGLVQLDRLMDVHLILSPSFVSTLLSLIEFPSSAHLRLSAFSQQDGLLSVFPKVDGLPHPHLTITKSSTLSIQLQDVHVHRSNAPSPPFSGFSSKPELTLIMPHPLPSYAWTISDMPRLFDLFGLTTLELDIGWAIDEDRLVTALYILLTATPNLTTLRASQHGAECLSRVLGKPGHDRLVTDVLCPRLTRLSFGAPDQMWWDLPLGWSKPLVACLRERMLCTGYPLTTIEFLGQGRIEKESSQVFEPFVEEILNSVTRLKRRA